jgi:hypothetical protein
MIIRPFLFTIPLHPLVKGEFDSGRIAFCSNYERLIFLKVCLINQISEVKSMRLPLFQRGLGGISIQKFARANCSFK